jgi:hypothetical protein
VTNQNRRVIHSLNKNGAGIPVPPPTPTPPTKIVQTRRVIRRQVRSGPLPRAARVPTPPAIQLEVPSYTPPEKLNGSLHMLALHSFSRHMTDEGWQLQEGFREAGYRLWGKDYEGDNTNVASILEEAGREGPIRTIIVQDKREWDQSREGCLDKEAGFHQCRLLREREDIFKVTICKDAHQNPQYHAEAADEIGCHAWVVYYHPQAIVRLAPHLRPQHLVRTYHSLDPTILPTYDPRDRLTCLLSGRISQDVYPLRHRISRYARYINGLDVHEHPGYHAKGHETADYLFLLSHYKVAICTASIYGYALRKIIEATAAGCIVITDLPEFDKLPEIDDNLVRVSPNVTLDKLQRLIRNLAEGYNAERQEDFAVRARRWYDYLKQGVRNSLAIEELRQQYAAEAKAAIP